MQFKVSDFLRVLHGAYSFCLATAGPLRFEKVEIASRKRYFIGGMLLPKGGKLKYYFL